MELKFKVSAHHFEWHKPDCSVPQCCFAWISDYEKLNQSSELFEWTNINELIVGYRESVLLVVKYTLLNL